MTAFDFISPFPEDVGVHLRNVADNLQLIADMGYGDAALAVVAPGGKLKIAADERASTAIAPFASSRYGCELDPVEEPEAYGVLLRSVPICGVRRRVARGIKYTTAAWPIGEPVPYAVVICDRADTVAKFAGAMEAAFMEAAEELLTELRGGPLVDYRTEGPFATTRSAGDGVLRVSAGGQVTYASPNAIRVMGLAGVEDPIIGSNATILPGAAIAITPVLGVGRSIATDVEAGGRVLEYRTIALPDGALVLVEDKTEAGRREQEIRVKEATIREVHHRVKNNLQTIASLLRIQLRRSSSEEARHALAEATERVSSMAVVHDLLAGSDKECVDFAQAARKIVSLMTSGLLGEGSGVRVTVEGQTDEVDAHTAMALALALAELVHNALEHGLAEKDAGHVEVTMRRLPGELELVVHDDGVGLPEGFEPATSANLGLTIVRTVIEDDLRGTLTFAGGRGTTVTVRVPLPDDAAAPEPGATGAGTPATHPTPPPTTED